MFADDTTIRSSSVHPSVAFARLQTHLDELYVYFNKWKIKVNAEKTEYMICTRKRTDLDHLLLKYGNVAIRRVNEMKILGVVLDKKLTFSSQINKVIAKATDVSRRLQPLLKRNSGVSQINKIFMYKVFIRSVLTYGINIWNATSVTNLRRVQVYQNKSLRRIRNLRPHPITYRQVSNETVHEMSNVEAISDFAKRTTLIFFERMRNHANALIRSLTTIVGGGRHPFDVIRDDILNN